MTTPENAAAPFRDDLTTRMKAAAEDPFSNAFSRFALDAGERGTSAIEQAVVALERQVRLRHPEVTSLFVKPQSASTYEARVRAREAPVTPDAGAPPTATS